MLLKHWLYIYKGTQGKKRMNEGENKMKIKTVTFGCGRYWPQLKAWFCEKVPAVVSDARILHKLKGVTYQNKLITSYRSLMISFYKFFRTPLEVLVA